MNANFDSNYQISFIHVSGHRIGTAEIEDALVNIKVLFLKFVYLKKKFNPNSLKDEHANVSESAVVAYPHDLFGEGIFAYVTLKENVKLTEKELVTQLKALVKSKIAHYAIPHRILVNL